AVAQALGLAGPVTFESPGTLVYIVRLGAPVLAWEVQLPLTMHPEPSRRAVWISAMTGRLLGEREQVQSARARVFPENPSTTPQARDVELPRTGVAPPGNALVSPTITAFNCVAEAPQDGLPWVQEGECHPVHRAFADDEGNFYASTPNVIVEADNVQPEDEYAELSMYYHGARFLDALRERGLATFSCPQASMMANVRTLIPEDEGAYDPLDNAFYTNQCDLEKGVTMMFGQGSQVDFAYDGDVVYHELGHGVVALLAPEGLGERRLRDDGSLVDSGAMNEAVADYMTYMMTDDPRVGEYVGRFWASNTRSEIRTGENTKRCPDDTVGQVHNDGEPFAAALWSTRARVGPVLDSLVLRMLPLLSRDATLEEGAAALLEVAAQMREEGALVSGDVEHLERALATRGLLDCPRVITDPDAVEAGRSIYLRRASVTVQPFLPGPMQLRAEVPAGATALKVHFGLRGAEDPEDRVVVLVKRNEGRVHFTYELIAVDDPGDSTGESGRIREVTRTDGDWDLELDPVEQIGGGYSATIANLHEGEIVHVAFAARGPSDLVATEVAVSPVGVPRMPEGVEDGADTDGGDLPAGASVSAQSTAAGGCGCHTGPGSAILFGWWILPLMLRRRRPRRG
ncbi:MAG: M36 family metallopeptidase, partial [Nannocystaceae bacterium]|nr:M36 family metallopeptidase [Nannocystaceae bacterium]